jgi:asparagine synthetase B (glutamine-hydrolysing)
MFCLIVTTAAANQKEHVQGRFDYLLRRSPRTLSVRSIGRNVIMIAAPEELSVIKANADESAILHGPYLAKQEFSSAHSSRLEYVATLAGRFPSHHVVTCSGNSGKVLVRRASIEFRPLYIHVMENGTVVIASHLLFMRILVGRLAPDAIAIVQQLGSSACVPTRTLLAQVRSVEPGTILNVDGGRVVSHRVESVLHGLNSNSSGAGTDRLWDLTKDVIEKTIPESSVCVALSGGFDSRFLVLASHAAGKQVSAITLGRREWIDVDIAIQFANVFGVRHHVVQPNADASLSGMMTVLDEVEHISDYLSPFWLKGYRDELVGLDRPVLNGFLGGPVTGGMQTSSRAIVSNEVLVKNWLNKVNRCAVRWSVLGNLCAVPVMPIRREIERYGAELTLGASDPNRTLEMQYRQRGFVYLNTGNLYSLYCNVRTPFADPRIRQFFEKLPPQALRRQALYKKTLLNVDPTGVPFASTTSRLYRPKSFTYGPMQFIYQEYKRLRKEMRSCVLDNKRQLGGLFHPESLAEVIQAAEENPTSERASFTEAILLVNAMLWWLQASEIP